MFFFDERVANLRKSFDFIVKIKAHPDSNVSGKRNGRVLRDSDPHTLPLLLTIPANVMVVFKDRNQDIQVQSLPVASLEAPKLTKGATLVIVKGAHIGEIVIHAKTEGDQTFVAAEGANRRKEGFWVPKSDVFIIETPQRS